MKPYYQDSSVTLYHGDCRDVLPLLAPESVDLVLTDPPYGIGYVTSRRATGDPMIAPITGDDHVPVKWARELKRVSRFRTAVYWFASQDSIEATRQALISIKFGLNTMLVWDKQAGTVGNLNDYGKRTEYIVFGTNGPVKMNGNRDGNLISVPRVNPRSMVHPTEKPVPLLSYLIIRSTDSGELVLDPFAGSGSAGFAAKVLGRKSILIEIDERYCEIAANRIEATPEPVTEAA